MLSNFPPGFGCSQPLALLLPAPAGSPGVLTPHRHRAGCWHVPVTCGVPLCPCSRHQQAARCQLVSAPHESLAPKQGAQHPGLWGCVTPPQLLGTTGGPVPCPTALPGSGAPRDMLPTRFPSACWEVPEVSRWVSLRLLQPSSRGLGASGGVCCPQTAPNHMLGL